MKKRLFYVCFCTVMAFALNACSDSCKTCSNNTYNSDGEVTVNVEPTEYCGVELIGIEATPDADINGSVTKWECY